MMMNFELHPQDSFIVRCPACTLCAFHPKVCSNCQSPIPKSTMMTVMRRDNTRFQTTVSEVLKTFIDYFEEPLDSDSSFRSQPKEKISQEPETPSKPKCSHENCPSAKYFVTGERGRRFLIEEAIERQECQLLTHEIIMEGTHFTPPPRADNDKIAVPKLQKDKEARNEATSQAQATTSRGFGNNSATEFIDDSDDDIIMLD